jgi:hypothetical protein
LAPAPAHAGAWILPEKGQEIWTSVAGAREQLYFFESSTYLEAPFDPSTSLVAAPWVEQNDDTIDASQQGEETVKAQLSLVRFNGRGPGRSIGTARAP